jgi:hypothetical protein
MDITEQIHMTLIDTTVIIIIVTIIPHIITAAMGIQETPIIHGHHHLKVIAHLQEAMTTIHGVKVITHQQRVTATLQETLALLRVIKVLPEAPAHPEVIAVLPEAPAHPEAHLQDDKWTRNRSKKHN